MFEKNVEKAKFASSYANQVNMDDNTKKDSRFILEQKKFDKMLEGEITQEELLSNRVTQRNNFDFSNALS